MSYGTYNVTFFICVGYCQFQTRFTLASTDNHAPHPQLTMAGVHLHWPVLTIVPLDNLFYCDSTIGLCSLTLLWLKLVFQKHKWNLFDTGMYILQVNKVSSKNVLDCFLWSNRSNMTQSGISNNCSAVLKYGKHCLTYFFELTRGVSGNYLYILAVQILASGSQAAVFDLKMHCNQNFAFS